MPITQARMLALISAGDDALRSARGWRSMTQDLATDVEAGKTEPSDAFYAMLAYGQNASAMPSDSAIETIATERAHYSHIRRRNNERSAQRQAAIRAALGAAPAYAPNDANETGPSDANAPNAAPHAPDDVDIQKDKA